MNIRTGLSAHLEESSISMDDTNEVRLKMARSILKEPLRTMMANSSPDEVIPVICEANGGYAGERPTLETLQSLLPGWANMESVGSENNPYYKCELTVSQLRELMDRILAEAQAPQAKERQLPISRIWYDHPIYPLVDRSVSTIKADAARRVYTADGRDILWAVLDSGIDKSHQHFTQDTLKESVPALHKDFSGSGDPLLDGFGHGTHVAAIIAGELTVKGVARRSRLDSSQAMETYEEEITRIAGIAPSCKLLSLKVLDDQGKGRISNVIAALDYIQTVNNQGRNLRVHGANLSLGYEFDPEWFACGQSPVCQEVNRLVKSGVVVVVAAGNTGTGRLAAAQRTTNAGLLLTINDPGNAQLAITVGSTHRDSPHTYGVSYFSSKGPTGDGRLKPDLVAPGERILSAKSSSTVEGKAANVYFEDSGTSMAAPHVSGAIAAFLSIRREFLGMPEDIKKLFLESATDLGRERYFQGRGLVDLMRTIQSI